MMCHYVIIGSIKDHTPSQMYLFDSKRAYDFAFYLQIVGIIITIVTNFWNASLDQKFKEWAREKCPKFFQDDESWTSAFTECCRFVMHRCRTPAEIEEANEASAAAGDTDHKIDVDESEPKVEELKEFPPTPKSHPATKTIKDRFKGKDMSEADA